MKTLKQIYIGMVILVISIIIIGTIVGYCFIPLGETAHKIITSNPSMNIVASVSSDNIKFILTIFMFNSLIAGALILISYLKSVTRYIKYVIYFELSYQIFTVSLMVGYALHLISYKLILATLLPHGVIEVPIIILAAAYGVYLCQDVEYNYKTITRNYILWIMIPLFISAVIEVIITPIVMSMV